MENYQEQRIVEKILRSLPHKYENLVVTIEEAKDLTTFRMDELMGILQTHEHKINRSKASSSQEKAFEAQSNPRGRGRGSLEEMAQVETPKVEAKEMEDRGMLQQKAYVQYMEQVALRILPEEVRKTITQIRVMQNATTIISLGIIQVNAKRNRVISQGRMQMMWLM